MAKQTIAVLRFSFPIKSIDEIFYNVDEGHGTFDTSMLYNLQNEVATTSID